MQSIRINVTLASILACILLIHSGHAQIRNLFQNGRSANQIPTKLQPSWSCIILGETGCFGTCSLMGALYDCETRSECRKGIYCECNEVYHFQQRDVPARNFQNLPLNELWNYRFQQTPGSTALLNQILNDDTMREYTSDLLRDPHITGEDVQYLLGDEYRQLVPQLQKLVVNPHGLKSELGINGELEYNNIGDYFSDLFQRIKKKVSEKIASAKSKRRILELIRNIDNKEDLQYVLRQILLSGDDKLYNFVSSYLRRNGRSVEEESLYQPRRPFGQRRRGCRKRKRCGGGWGGGMDYESPPSGGAWHGRPLKRKIIITHNDATIKIDADEDEVIEIALINELKKVEDGADLSKKQQQVIPPPPPNPIGQEIPTSVTPQGNTYMQGITPGLVNSFMQSTIPSQGNAYTQGTQGPFMNTPPQIPLLQGKTELHSMVPPEMNQYASPVMSTPTQGNIFTQETFRPQIPVLPDYQESYSSISSVNSLPTQPINILQQELPPSMVTNVPQVPNVQQEQYEILTPPQMTPIPLELSTPSQYTSFTQGSIPSMSMTDTAPLYQIEEIQTPLPQMKLMPLYTPTSPSSEYSVIQEAIAPISVNNPMAHIPTMYSKEDISVLPPQMEQIPLISPQNNFHIQETMTPFPTASTVQPLVHQIEAELPQPLQIKPVFSEGPIPSYNALMQETLPSITPDTMSNALSNIQTYNDIDKYQPLMNQDIIKQSMDYLPVVETSQPYSSVKPIIGEVENTFSNLSLPSTTTFYADQSPELRPLLSPTIGSNSPQTVYEYVNSATNLPSLNYDLENSTPPSISSSNFNLGNMTPPKMPSIDLENMSPSVSSLTYDFGTPSNMATELNSQFQNSLPNLPSSSLTSYTNQIGLPQTSYSFQTSSLPGLNTSNMEWMSTPSTFSTMSSNLGSMIPQSSWFSQTSNVTPQNDNLPSTSTNSGLTWLQENMPSFKESIPSSQTLNKSFIHEDIPRFIEQTTTHNPANSDEEFQVGKTQNISESGITISQNIRNEIEEVADNFTTESIQQGNKMVLSEQNSESNMMSMQQGISQSIPDPGKKKKSLFYMVIDDTGNVVHSASVDHEEERQKQAATQTTSTFPYFSQYFSQTVPVAESKPQNYGWPYWSK